MGIDAYLFGYRIVFPEEGGEARLANALLRLGIVAVGERSGGFIIRAADFGAFRVYAGGRVRYTATEVLGLPAHIRSLLSHIPTLVAAILSLLLSLFLSHLVWDVRIEGAEELTEGRVEEVLREAGIGVGSLWDGVDVSEVEAAVLDSEPGIAWVQINRRGSVAEVIVREREQIDEPYVSPYACSNVVAEFDGVIEDITVSAGQALVKAGDAVKRGDILISGIVESERGTYFTAAAGSVVAHVSGSLYATAALVEREPVTLGGGVLSLKLRILGAEINIFKKGSNWREGCDIIEAEEEYLCAFGRRFPIAVVRERGYTSEERTLSYSASELPELASQRLELMLSEELGGADLIKLRTFGEYSDEGYTITAQYVISVDIGAEREVRLE